MDDATLLESLKIEIKKDLLEDKEFREKLFKLYYADEERFLNKLLKKASANADTSKI